MHTCAQNYSPRCTAPTNHADRSAGETNGDIVVLDGQTAEETMLRKRRLVKAVLHGGVLGRRKRRRVLNAVAALHGAGITASASAARRGGRRGSSGSSRGDRRRRGSPGGSRVRARRRRPVRGRAPRGRTSASPNAGASAGDSTRVGDRVGDSFAGPVGLGVPVGSVRLRPSRRRRRRL